MQGEGKSRRVTNKHELPLSHTRGSMVGWSTTKEPGNHAVTHLARALIVPTSDGSLRLWKSDGWWFGWYTWGRALGLVPQL